MTIPLLSTLIIVFFLAHQPGMNPRHPSCLAHRLQPSTSLRLSAATARQQQCRASVFALSAPARRSRSTSSSRLRAASPNDRHPSWAPKWTWQRPSPRLATAALVAAAGLVSLTLLFPSASMRTPFAAEASIPVSAPDPPTTADIRDPGLPRFRIAEIRSHGAQSENPWVIHGDRVYDITDWIPAHPGGQVILRAAGASIDPYWNIFTIHKNQYVYDILSQYLIGYIDQADLVDGKPAQEQIQDPFEDDPERHPSLITKTSKPRNAETPGDALGAHFLTPNDLFYVRNHMWVPKIDSDAHVLTVELLDGTVKQYTLEDLKSKFPSCRVTAVLQCSGNRRKHMSQGSGRSTNGLQWTAGAISNASWEGVLLADVLADAGFDVAQGLSGTSEAKHVHFSGMEAYAASIPIRKAVDPQGDVVLAYAMNDMPLPRDHGFPLRAIVPGHVAARSVKWLNQITLSEEESMSQWQRRDYKCFGPNETEVDWDAAPAIQELPVQSAITGVKLGGWTNARDSPEQEPTQEVSLSGYAVSGGGRSVIRVDVSLDGGSSWAQAYLVPDCTVQDGNSSPCQGHGAWAWKRWRFDGAVPFGAFRDREQAKEYPADAKSEAMTGEDGDGCRRCTTVLVKATDDAYNTQPESHAATWNLRGNLATAWHRIQVCTDCPTSANAATVETGDKGGPGRPS